jgi:hypothetical protein
LIVVSVSHQSINATTKLILRVDGHSISYR